jgi:Spy/CpxP family protein refolding chaperone
MVTGKQMGAVALLVATFAVGAVVGRVSTRLGSPEAEQGSRSGDRTNRRGGFLNTLQHELDLTPAQRDSVQSILRKWDPAMRAVWDGTRPKFDSLRVLVRADIMQMLTPDQKTAFQRWSARQDSVVRIRRQDSAARNRREEEGRGR